MKLNLKTLLSFSILLWILQTNFAATYFVATDGDNSNDGSLNAPWATIKYAFTQLAAGDTLNIREGIYHESTITTTLQGTVNDPIVIKAYQNEQVTISGGSEQFMNAPNSEWTIVDASIDLYKSNSTISGSFVNAWLPDDNLHIIEYEDSLNLKSENYGPVDGFNPLYQGPGIMLLEDGHLYIRLVQNPNDLVDVDSNSIEAIPVDTDPNHNNINVFSKKTMFYLEGAQYLIFKDINMYYAKYIFDIRTGSNNIEFDHCNFKYGNTCMVVRDGSSFNIHHCDFENGIPQYVYWTDVKNKAYEVHEPYPEFQSKAITGKLIDFTIENCNFYNGFDAIGVMDTSSNTSIMYNNFVRFRDDALDLRAGITDIEIAYNMFWSVGSGISMTETEDTTPGQVYIHHNVIDNSIYQHGGREGNYREDNWPVWTVIDPFGSHGDDMKAYWKVYNNTIVTRKSGYHWTAAGLNAILGNPEKYVFNNVFLVLDDRIIFRGDSAVDGAHYDGNVFYRYAPTTYPLFYDFGDGNNYDSLSEFQNNSGTDWELNGLETDPELDTFAINNETYDSVYIWERYRPRNPLIYSLGISYSGYNWPGTSNIYYRGALEPGTAIWNGTNTNWNDPVNWTKHIVPDEAYKVIIPTVPEFGNFPIIQDTVMAKCYNITNEDNAMITIFGYLYILK